MVYAFGGPLTPAVKYIIIANLVVFFLQLIYSPLTWALALVPSDLLTHFELWRPITWMFVHGGLFHLIFNMLALFMFGCELERYWGTRAFTRYYFVCGVGAAFFTMLPLNAIRNVPHIGASGAIYGVLLAYGLSFPRRTIYFMMTVPLEARYFVIVSGLIAFYASLGDPNSGVSDVAHLGGMVVGYLYLKTGWGRKRALLPDFRGAYRRWRMKRLRKKFEEYYQKRGGGSGPHYTVH